MVECSGLVALVEGVLKAFVALLAFVVESV
jgi:hypothetical protein